MTSWTSFTRPNRIPTFREGYYQDLPLGTFTQKDAPATVVSAYYEMKSKYPATEYRTWIRNFLEHFPCHLVFFTEESLVPFIQECRAAHTDKTRIIVLPRAEWKANTAFPPTFWEQQAALDPERAIHSTDLYKVWYEKKEFVRRAIELNPFGHTDFVWTDAGVFRNADLVEAIAPQYPVASRIPTDRILLLNYIPFTPSDERVHEFPGNIRIHFPYDKMRIHGACLAGSVTAWKWWIDAYDETIGRFQKAGLFVGKDQTIMASLVLEYRNKTALLDLRRAAPDMWHYLILYLGCSESWYKFLRSDKARQGSRMTYTQFIKN